MERRWLDEVACLVADDADRERSLGASRRGVVRAAIGAALATSGMTVGVTRTEAGAGCKIAGRKCHRDTQCCTLRCHRRRCRR